MPKEVQKLGLRPPKKSLVGKVDFRMGSSNKVDFFLDRFLLSPRVVVLCFIDVYIGHSQTSRLSQYVSLFRDSLWKYETRPGLIQHLIFLSLLFRQFFIHHEEASQFIIVLNQLRRARREVDNKTVGTFFQFGPLYFLEIFQCQIVSFRKH